MIGFGETGECSNVQVKIDLDFEERKVQRFRSNVPNTDCAICDQADRGSFITVLYFRCDLVNVSITNFPAVKMINVMNLRYKNITYSNSQQAQSTESMNEIPHCVKCNNELEYGLRNRI